MRRVMLVVVVVFIVLHSPRICLMLYEVTRIPTILNCIFHGCRYSLTLFHFLPLPPSFALSFSRFTKCPGSHHPQLYLQVQIMCLCLHQRCHKDLRQGLHKVESREARFFFGFACP